jgi:hypothetical protein
MENKNASLFDRISLENSGGSACKKWALKYLGKLN